MKHAIIVVNYNNYNDTIRCVNSLLALKGNKEILILDNGSSNNAYEELLTTYNGKKEVMVLRNPDNLGYSKGIDFAYQFINDNGMDFDFIHVSNSDIIVEDISFLEKIESIYLQQPFYILGPRVITNGINTSPIGYFKTSDDFWKEMKKLNVLASGLKVFSTITFDRFENILEGNRNASIATNVINKINNGDNIVPILSGCYTIFSKQHYQKFNYLYRPLTFLYNEEMLITYTLMEAGIKEIYFNNDLEVIHKHGGSSKGASKRKAMYIKDNYKQFKKLLK